MSTLTTVEKWSKITADLFCASHLHFLIENIRTAEKPELGTGYQLQELVQESK